MFNWKQMAVLVMVRQIDCRLSTLHLLIASRAIGPDYALVIYSPVRLDPGRAAMHKNLTQLACWLF